MRVPSRLILGGLGLLLSVACSSSGHSVTTEQETFMESVWTFEGILHGPPSQVPHLDAASADTWLLASMDRSSFDHQANTDLFQGKIDVKLRTTSDDPDFRRRAAGELTPNDAQEFLVSITSENGKRTDWLINGWGWTFLNDEARRWLVAHRWKSLCDELVSIGQAQKADIVRLQGEVCRQALDGRVAR